jgi:hypothetical protein
LDRKRRKKCHSITEFSIVRAPASSGDKYPLLADEKGTAEVDRGALMAAQKTYHVI